VLVARLQEHLREQASPEEEDAPSAAAIAAVAAAAGSSSTASVAGSVSASPEVDCAVLSQFSSYVLYDTAHMNAQIL
jgi:3-oxoacyl-ACP reductase-like protein